MDYGRAIHTDKEKNILEVLGNHRQHHMTTQCLLNICWLNEGAMQEARRARHFLWELLLRSGDGCS